MAESLLANKSATVSGWGFVSGSRRRSDPARASASLSGGRSNRGVLIPGPVVFGSVNLFTLDAQSRRPCRLPQCHCFSKSIVSYDPPRTVYTPHCSMKQRNPCIPTRTEGPQKHLRRDESSTRVDPKDGDEPVYIRPHQWLMIREIL